jgi:glycerophosphoryl diester phosphodiesterase
VLGPQESALFALVRRVKPTWFAALTGAHRGASQDAPENSLAALRRAVDVGSDLVEFDIHATKDGDLVVIHDDKVDRTTNGHGEVRKLTTAEVRELDAGSWFSDAFAGERVPLLDEALDVLRGRAVPLIEIKVKKKRAPDAGERAVAALARHGMLDSAVVICREPDRLLEVRAASKRVPIAYLTYTKRMARGAAKLDGVGGLDIYWKTLSLALVEDLRSRAGFFLVPWTVNRRTDQERTLLLGLETVLTDSPVAFRDLIEEFEFSRAEETLERFRATGEDIDLELEASGGHPSPQSLEAELGTESDVDLP